MAQRIPRWAITIRAVLHTTTGSKGHAPSTAICLEGLASGPAILARWGATLSNLPEKSAAHELVAHYLAQACHTLFATTSVEKVVLGGGVLQTLGLRERIAELATDFDAGYLPGGKRHQIIAPRLEQMSGITGAMILAS